MLSRKAQVLLPGNVEQKEKDHDFFFFFFLLFTEPVDISDEEKSM